MLRLLVVIFASFFGLSIISCISSPNSLLVIQDRVSQNHIKSEDRMVAFRSESELNQYIHVSDWDDAEGEYFTFRWGHMQLDSTADLQLVFYYRASKTQAEVLKEIWEIEDSSKQHQFAYTQKWVEEKGDLLSWKVQLKTGDQVLSEQRSYLWKDKY